MHFLSKTLQSMNSSTVTSMGLHVFLRWWQAVPTWRLQPSVSVFCLSGTGNICMPDQDVAYPSQSSGNDVPIVCTSICALHVCVTCRTAAFANLGIVEAKHYGMPHITMLKKEGRRVMENADEVTSQLRQRFPSAKFEVLEGKAIATMSLKEQVKHLFSQFSKFSIAQSICSLITSEQPQPIILPLQ